MVRLKGLEPTRIAAREPKGTVTLVKNHKSIQSMFVKPFPTAFAECIHFLRRSDRLSACCKDH